MSLKVIVSVLALLSLNACASSVIAKPVLCSTNLNSPISNFCEVQARKLWRGAKPDEKSAAWLINNGVKTIINLELLYDDRDALHEARVNRGLYQVDYFRVQTWEPLFAVAQETADKDVIHFLAIALHAKPPVYVHCRAGENRTGVMIAAYKIIVEGQDVTAVLEEMQSYKGLWSTAMTQYIRGLSLRRDEILREVKAFKVERPEQIICEYGQCRSRS